jgi:hypothetical protein
MINITLTSGNILRLDDGVNPQINISLTHTPGDWYHIAVVRSGLFLRVYENATLLGQFNLNSIVNYQTNFVQDGPKSIFDTIVLPRAVTQEEIEYYYDNVLKGGDEVLPDL